MVVRGTSREGSGGSWLCERKNQLGSLNGSGVKAKRRKEMCSRGDENVGAPRLSLRSHSEPSRRFRAAPTPGAVSPLRTFQNHVMVWVGESLLHCAPRAFYEGGFPDAFADSLIMCPLHIKVINRKPNNILAIAFLLSKMRQWLS